MSISEVARWLQLFTVPKHHVIGFQSYQTQFSNITENRRWGELKKVKKLIENCENEYICQITQQKKRKVKCAS